MGTLKIQSDIQHLITLRCFDKNHTSLTVFLWHLKTKCAHQFQAIHRSLIQYAIFVILQRIIVLLAKQ